MYQITPLKFIHSISNAISSLFCLFSHHAPSLPLFVFFQVHLACPKGNAGTLPSPPRAAARAAPPLLSGAADQRVAWSPRHVYSSFSQIPETRLLCLPECIKYTVRHMYRERQCRKAWIFMFCTHGCACTPRNEAVLFYFQCALCPHKPFAWTSHVSAQLSSHLINTCVAWMNVICWVDDAAEPFLFLLSCGPHLYAFALWAAHAIIEVCRCYIISWFIYSELVVHADRNTSTTVRLRRLDLLLNS